MALGIKTKSYRKNNPGQSGTLIDGRQFIREQGNVWFVDANRGATGSGDGTTLDSAFGTMATAFARLASGDTVFVRGKVREQLVTPVQVFDVSIVGLGNRPRHADSTPAGGEIAANSWTAPASGAVAGQANVRVLQQGWSFENLLMYAGDSTAACIEIVRNAGSGNDERDASHCRVTGNRFAGAGIGVRFNNSGYSENPYNCEIEYNKFNDSTTAIQGTQCNSASIHHNEFQGCTSIITLAAQNTMIYENVLGAFTAAANSGGIDLNGGGGKCFVVKNYLSGTYSIAGGYRVSGANDEWAGNWNTIAGGITVADPA